MSDLVGCAIDLEDLEDLEDGEEAVILLEDADTGDCIYDLVEACGGSSAGRTRRERGARYYVPALSLRSRLWKAA